MEAIYKYPVRVQGLPFGYEILHVEQQNDETFIWAKVDTDPTVIEVPVSFTVLGTGEPIPDNMKYIATWQKPPFVWHLFECLSA